MDRPPRSQSISGGDSILGDGSNGFPFSEEQMDCTQDGGTESMSYTDLLVNGVDQSQLADPIDATSNVVPGLVKSTQGRGPTFSTEEDVLLVSAWLNVGTDPVIGVDQSHGTMWARIYQYYHENKGALVTTRTESSLLNRWSAIQHNVNAFSGCLSRIEGRKKSGIRDTDKMADACELFKSEDKKHRKFQVMHCWSILKDQPKWMERRKENASVKKSSNKKQKTAANGSPAPVEPAAPDGAVQDAQPIGRPAGRKKEKQKLRQGRNIEAVDYLMEKKKEADSERELKKDDRCKKAFAMQEERSKKNFALQEERIQLEREKFEFKKKEAEKEEERILALDLSTLNSNQQQYYDWRQKQILAKRCNI